MLQRCVQWKPRECIIPDFSHFQAGRPPSYKVSKCGVRGFTGPASLRKGDHQKQTEKSETVKNGQWAHSNWLISSAHQVWCLHGAFPRSIRLTLVFTTAKKKKRAWKRPKNAVKLGWMVLIMEYLVQGTSFRHERRWIRAFHFFSFVFLPLPEPTKGGILTLNHL